MAGINIEKYHGGTEAKAVLRHCDREQRLRGEHANKQIDKSKTGHNQEWFVQGCNDTYAGVCSMYDSRIQEVDSNAVRSPRKDRVTLVGMELPRPELLPADRFNEWATDAIHAINNYYSGMQAHSGFLSAYAHVDEVHDYKRFDETEQKYYNTSSREHLHIFMTPYSEDGNSLNAKQFTNRKNLIALNKVIDNMTFEKYNVRFCNGTGRKSKKSVEELKVESDIAAIHYKDYMRAEQLQKENTELTRTITRLNGQIEDLEYEVRELRAKTDKVPVRAFEDMSFMDKKKAVLSENTKNKGNYTDMPKASPEHAKYNNTSYREVPNINSDDSAEREIADILSGLR